MYASVYALIVLFLYIFTLDLHSFILGIYSLQNYSMAYLYNTGTVHYIYFIDTMNLNNVNGIMAVNSWNSFLVNFVNGSMFIN